MDQLYGWAVLQKTQPLGSTVQLQLLLEGARHKMLHVRTVAPSNAANQASTWDQQQYVRANAKSLVTFLREKNWPAGVTLDLRERLELLASNQWGIQAAQTQSTQSPPVQTPTPADKSALMQTALQNTLNNSPELQRSINRLQQQAKELTGRGSTTAAPGGSPPPDDKKIAIFAAALASVAGELANQVGKIVSGESPDSPALQAQHIATSFVANLVFPGSNGKLMAQIFLSGGQASLENLLNQYAELAAGTRSEINSWEAIYAGLFGGALGGAMHVSAEVIKKLIGTFGHPKIAGYEVVPQGAEKYGLQPEEKTQPMKVQGGEPLGQQRPNTKPSTQASSPRGDGLNAGGLGKVFALLGGSSPQRVQALTTVYKDFEKIMEDAGGKRLDDESAGLPMGMYFETEKDLVKARNTFAYYRYGTKSDSINEPNIDLSDIAFNTVERRVAAPNGKVFYILELQLKNIFTFKFRSSFIFANDEINYIYNEAFEKYTKIRGWTDVGLWDYIPETKESLRYLLRNAPGVFEKAYKVTLPGIKFGNPFSGLYATQDEADRAIAQLIGGKDKPTSEFSMLVYEVKQAPDSPPVYLLSVRPGGKMQAAKDWLDAQAVFEWAKGNNFTVNAREILHSHPHVANSTSHVFPSGLSVREFTEEIADLEIFINNSHGLNNSRFFMKLEGALQGVFSPAPGSRAGSVKVTVKLPQGEAAEFFYKKILSLANQYQKSGKSSDLKKFVTAVDEIDATIQYFSSNGSPGDVKKIKLASSLSDSEKPNMANFFVGCTVAEGVEALGCLGGTAFLGLLVGNLINNKQPDQQDKKPASN